MKMMRKMMAVTVFIYILSIEKHTPSTNTTTTLHKDTHYDEKIKDEDQFDEKNQHE